MSVRSSISEFCTNFVVNDSFRFAFFCVFLPKNQQKPRLFSAVGNQAKSTHKVFPASSRAPDSVLHSCPPLLWPLDYMRRADPHHRRHPGLPIPGSGALHSPPARPGCPRSR